MFILKSVSPANGATVFMRHQLLCKKHYVVPHNTPNDSPKDEFKHIYLFKKKVFLKKTNEILRHHHRTDF